MNRVAIKAFLLQGRITSFVASSFVFSVSLLHQAQAAVPAASLCHGEVPFGGVQRVFQTANLHGSEPTFQAMLLGLSEEFHDLMLSPDRVRGSVHLQTPPSRTIVAR